MEYNHAQQQDKLSTRPDTPLKKKKKKKNVAM